METNIAKKRIEQLTQDPNLWQTYTRRIKIATFLLFAFIVFMPWMQTVPGEGRIVAFDAQERRQELSAPIDGRIQKWFVKEGDMVKKGDPIVEMGDNDPLILTRMGNERTALEKKFQSMELARKTSAINVERQRQLYDSGLSSRRQYEMAKMELAKLESDEAAALADMSRIDTRLSRQEQQMITAPIDGTVVRILKNSMAGVDYIHAGEALAILVPETTSRIVELWISGNDMPWVSEGKRVALQFEGWPSMVFSGVPNASVGVFFGKVHLVDALDDGQGNFRALIIPENPETWPSAAYLKQGVRAFAWIMLNEVPLIYEIWRRFNGFPPSNLPVYQNQKQDVEKSNLKSKQGKSK